MCSPWAKLTRDIPGYGLDIAKVFARRLEGFIKHMRWKKRRTELFESDQIS
jgi:hypothetical protein